MDAFNFIFLILIKKIKISNNPIIANILDGLDNIEDILVPKSDIDGSLDLKLKFGIIDNNM